MDKQIIKNKFKEYFRYSNDMHHVLIHENIEYVAQRDGRKIYIQRGGISKKTNGTVDEFKHGNIAAVLFVNNDVNPTGPQRTVNPTEWKINNEIFKLHDYNNEDLKKDKIKYMSLNSNNSTVLNKLIKDKFGYIEDGVDTYIEDTVDKVIQNKFEINKKIKELDGKYSSIGFDEGKANKLYDYKSIMDDHSSLPKKDDIMVKLNTIENIFVKYKDDINTYVNDNVAIGDETKNIYDYAMEIIEKINKDKENKDYKDQIKKQDKFKNVYNPIINDVESINSNLEILNKIKKELNYETPENFDGKYAKFDNLVKQLKQNNNNLLINIDKFKHSIKTTRQQDYHDDLIGHTTAWTGDHKTRFNDALGKEYAKKLKSTDNKKEVHEEYKEKYGIDYMNTLYSENTLISQLQLAHIFIRLLIARQKAKDQTTNIDTFREYFAAVHQYNPTGPHANAPKIS